MGGVEPPRPVRPGGSHPARRRQPSDASTPAPDVGDLLHQLAYRRQDRVHLAARGAAQAAAPRQQGRGGQQRSGHQRLTGQRRLRGIQGHPTVPRRIHPRGVTPRRTRHHRHRGDAQDDSVGRRGQARCPGVCRPQRPDRTGIPQTVGGTVEPRAGRVGPSGPDSGRPGDHCPRVPAYRCGAAETAMTTITEPTEHTTAAWRRTENIMLLENKNAVIYGAAGAVGSTVARAFAREGARVFLTGRNLGAIQTLGKEISVAGGTAETAEVDALDEQAVTSHLDAVVNQAGTVDISFNAIGIPQQGMQGIPLTELSVESFTLPITTYTQSHFVTGRAAGRHMITQRSGVVLMHTPEPARVAAPLLGGMSPAWAAMESLNRAFSAEWAPHGVRAVCLRTTGMEETPTIDVVFGLHPSDMESPKKNFGPPWPPILTGNARPRWKNSPKWLLSWPPIAPPQ